MTLQDLLKESSVLLEKTSPTARLDAEVLIAHILGKDRSYFYTWPEREVTKPDLDTIRQQIQNRAGGTPVAYLTGTREFWSRSFTVSPDTLIPRPETELLIELALDRIPLERPFSIADLGTGSGIIGITLALERPLCQVVAVDIEPAAVTIATANAEAHQTKNISCQYSDWFDSLNPHLFDLIVSNPPYIEDTDPHLTDSDIRFEPPLALVSGSDGLDAIRRIIHDARYWIKPSGNILLEHGFNQQDGVRGICLNNDFHNITTHRDLQNHPRVTSAQWK